MEKTDLDIQKNFSLSKHKWFCIMQILAKELVCKGQVRKMLKLWEKFLSLITLCNHCTITIIKYNIIGIIKC